MEILNTAEHVGQAGNITVGIIFAIVALATLVLAVAAAFAKEGAALLAVFVAFLFGAASWLTLSDPGKTQHEVRITPGTVIDAQKYKVVETRGSIVVIEELRK